NTQSVINDSFAAIAQLGLGNAGFNLQTGADDLSATILQAGVRNLGVNLQDDADGSTALIAQLGVNNRAANWQRYGSSDVLAGIVQVGANNRALNVQGEEQSVSYTFKAAGEEGKYHPKYVLFGPEVFTGLRWTDIGVGGTDSAPAQASIAIAAQIGDDNFAVNSQAGQVIVPETLTYFGSG